MHYEKKKEKLSYSVVYHTNPHFGHTTHATMNSGCDKSGTLVAEPNVQTESPPLQQSAP